MDALLQTLLGGIIALAGAAIGPWLQRNHERWRAQREDEHLVREKAQELFDELDRVVRDSAKASVRAMERITNKDLEAFPVPDLGKIRAISLTYFPDLMNAISSFEIKHAALAEKIIAEARAATDKGDAGLDILKALPVLMVTSYQEVANDLVKAIRTDISQHIPTLKLEAR
jgi:hypothetical protein